MLIINIVRAEKLMEGTFARQKPLLTPFPYQGNSNVLFSLIRTLTSPKVLLLGNEKEKVIFFLHFARLFVPLQQ